jgi:16S rRNA (cytosine967-C5)-methyltransferase
MMNNEQRPRPSRPERNDRPADRGRRSTGRPERGNRTPPSARAIALEALRRVDEDEAFANLVLPDLLRSIEDPRAGYAALDGREKGFATELFYGTVRMRRACDWVVQPFLDRDPDPDTERVLHVAAYQLVFLKTPAHAALSSMVGEAPERSRGFVNAVLRKVAASLEAAEGRVEWPDLATELSYPDWIVATLSADLGGDITETVLRAMNQAAIVHRRADGYVQDPASQTVAALVGAGPGDRVLDLCAAPGGKTTAMAAAGARVTALDLYAHRCDLIAENVHSLGLGDRVEIHCLDATDLPGELADGAFDRVLLDAPCSGLGSLRRRPDARWRMTIDDVESLVDLQRALLRSAAAAVRPGGLITYAVCTLTNAESVDHEAWIEKNLPQLTFEPMSQPEGWLANGRGLRMLPDETDGMSVFQLRRSR